jgi:hypothetical protein
MELLSPATKLHYAQIRWRETVRIIVVVLVCLFVSLLVCWFVWRLVCSCSCCFCRRRRFMIVLCHCYVLANDRSEWLLRGYVYGDLKWAIPMKEDSAQRVAYILGIRKGYLLFCFVFRFVLMFLILLFCWLWLISLEKPQCIVSTHCLLELDEYSLGNVRTVDEWKKWTGACRLTEWCFIILWIDFSTFNLLFCISPSSLHFPVSDWVGIDMNKRTQQDRCHQHFDYHKNEWVRDPWG